RLTDQVSAKILVWGKDDGLLRRYRPNNLFSVGRGTDNITQRFDSCRAVDVRNDYMIRVCLTKPAEGFGFSRVCKRATGFQVRQNYLLVRIENLGGFTHEVNTCEHDHVGCGLLGLL